MGPIDAVVLAGGRARRLDGVDKASLLAPGGTLLDRTLAAVSPARRVVVVGAVSGVPAGVLSTRERPPYSGPAAAVAAGLDALSEDPAEALLVVACDVPRLAEVVPALVAALPEAADGVLARDDHGRAQYLAAAFRTAALAAAVDRHRADLVGLSMRLLLDGLDLATAGVPAGSARDVDTWADADELGVRAPTEEEPDA